MPHYLGVRRRRSCSRISTTTRSNTSSGEKPALAPPITFLIRGVLESAADYDEAVEWLATQGGTSDSLLLVTGVEAGQMVVIERSPTRAAIRKPANGFVHVTNDYKSLPSSEATGVVATFSETSCGRFDRAQSMIGANRPSCADACSAILGDPEVKMLITVQSTVFCAGVAASSSVYKRSNLQTAGTSALLLVNTPA